jgi:histidine ammonia-lyase
LQFVATSTTAINQSLSAPHAVHSIPTNADNQDIVSLGTDAALLAMRVAENALVVLTIEAIALAQAVDCAGIAEQLCPESRALYAAIREECSTLREDRVLGPDLVKVIERLRRDPAIGLEWA